jgi:hypothetical protein
LQLFFPKSDPLVGTLEAFAIYAVGFVARPVGAANFRALRGPDRSQINIDRHVDADGVCHLFGGIGPNLREHRDLGAIILTLFRFVQGVGVGGEWGGSVLLSMEWAGQTPPGA